MCPLRSLVAAALFAGASAQPPPCPEPVAALLRAGQLWDLHVHDVDCASGDPEFHAQTPHGEMHGRWEGLCHGTGGANASANASANLTITAEPEGLGSPCKTDDDCAFIPCGTRCEPCTDAGCRHSHECFSVSPDCHNRTSVQISPSSFEDACPPDPRDSVCYEGYPHFEAMGCEAFSEPPDSSAPTSTMSEIASGCLQLINGYIDCVKGNFSTDPAYLQHRMPPPEVVSFMWAVAGAGSSPPPPTERCVYVPHALATELRAVPCAR